MRCPLCLQGKLLKVDEISKPKLNIKATFYTCLKCGKRVQINEVIDPKKPIGDPNVLSS